MSLPRVVALTAAFPLVAAAQDRDCRPMAHAVTLRVERADGRPVDDAVIEVYLRRTGALVRRVEHSLGDGRYALFTSDDGPDAVLSASAYGVRVRWGQQTQRATLVLATTGIAGCEHPTLERPRVIRLR